MPTSDRSATTSRAPAASWSTAPRRSRVRRGQLIGLVCLFFGIASAVTLSTSMAAATSVSVADVRADAAPGGWALPVNAAVVRRFDTGPYPWSPGHRGVDFGVTGGLPVRTPADGVVVFAGAVAGRGVLVVEHVTPSAVLRSSFEPVRGLLPIGSSVRRGQIVAEVLFSESASDGSAAGDHCSGRACLHWGVRQGTTYLDPLSLIGVRPVVLLPLLASRGTSW